MVDQKNLSLRETIPSEYCRFISVEPTSECAELQQLRKMYDASIRAYQGLIAILDHVSTDREFEQAYERAEGARLLFVRTRFNLLYHIQEHSCVVPAEEEAATAP